MSDPAPTVEGVPVAPPPTEDWTYQGRRLDGRGRLYYLWVAMGRPNHDHHRWSKQIAAGATVGSTWRITLDLDDGGTTSIWTAGQRRPRPVPRPDYVNDAAIIKWDLEDQAAAVERQARTRQGDLPDLHAILLPIKVIYHNRRTRQGKAAVLAAVLAELERW